MHYVDFHCHLDLYPDFSAEVQEAERAQVYTLTVTTTPRAWPRNFELSCQTKFVRAALGLHPQLVKDHEAEIYLWDQYLPQTRYVGEVGIDAGPRYYKSVEAQKDIFEHVLKSCARSGGKILTVHSARSAKIVLDLVEKHFPAKAGTVILHWFTGTKSEARRAAALGCYFSVNAQMLSGKRGREVAAALPVDRLLTETDGPFTQSGNHIASPADVGKTVEMLAQLIQRSTQLTAEIIHRNLKTMLESPAFPSANRV